VRAVTIRAVIFDLGGVVFPSPFETFNAYERDHGLPVDFIRRVVGAEGPDGAWNRFERSELTMDEFQVALAAETRAAGGEVDARDLLGRMTGIGGGPRPEMVHAIGVIRAEGLKAGALTNNWATDGASDTLPGLVGDLFDVVVESAKVGLRKPDPAIYHYVCDALDVTPPESAFLDDLGVNLKGARALGMHTIKVNDAGAALLELSTLLGFPLAP
jgi:putative hydrolase of the HAD superfamily